MNYEMIRIAREREVSRQLYELFEGDIVENIIKETRIEPEKKKNLLKSILAGKGFQISKTMAPEIYELCLSVKQSLAFDEPIDFFVVNDPVANCSVFPRMEENESHLVKISSGLLEHFNNDELRFVLGHEIGHLISRNSILTRIINYVFPEINNAPLVLMNKIIFWSKLDELSADRFGFLASPNIESCISCFFKLSSGLDINRIRFDPNKYLEDINDKVELLKENSYDFSSSHPVNPIRIKAINLLNDSELYRALSRGETNIPEDVALQKKMEELIDVLLKKGNSAMDEYRRQLIATGGLLVAYGGEDGLNEHELKRIIEALASFDVFPEAYLWEIAQSENIVEKFEETVATILKYNPAERYAILNFLILIALSDSIIEKKETDIIYQIGENLLGFTRLEISQEIGKNIRENFIPKLI